MDTLEEDPSDILYVIVNNIPKEYRSADLRNYFSQFIESGGFECFHFKHRPEVQKVVRREQSNEHSTLQNQCKSTQCCVVKLRSCKYDEFSRMYNKHHWLDKRGDSIPALCHISKVKVSEGK